MWRGGAEHVENLDGSDILERLVFFDGHVELFTKVCGGELKESWGYGTFDHLP